MKLVRTVSLIALAVVLGMGFLAGTADAAVLDSVRIVSPDSGAIRGIDSLITTEVFFRTVDADSSNIHVYWWLATKGAATDTVRDESALPAALADSLESILGLASNAYTTNNTPVAIRTTLSQAGVIAGTGFSGDMEIGGAQGDTIIVAQGPAVSSGKSWKVTIRYAVDSGIGKAGGIGVYTAVYETSQAQWTGVKNSYRTVRLDGLRPVASSATAMSVNPAIALGASSVAGFTGGTYNVIGIGDTVEVQYDLGTQAGAILLTGDLRMSAILAGKAINLGVPRGRLDTARVVIQSGQFDNIAIGSTPGTVALYLTDPAGNLSSDDANDVSPVGLTNSANFLLDATAPLLDAQVAGNDTILPVANDTITDGGAHVDVDTWLTVADDRRPMSFNLGEALYKLDISFDNSDNALDRSYSIYSAGGSATRTAAINKALSVNQTRLVNLPNAQATADSELYVSTATPADFTDSLSTTIATSLATGRYTVTFQGTDLAGNTGTALSRANVYVDVTDVTVGSQFPTKLAYGPVNVARLDTIEEITSQVQFQLSEPTDSVLIVYRGLSGTDASVTKTRRLSGSQLLNTSSVQTFAVDSLKSLTTYALAILARDLAGNYSVIGPDTFRYDTSFVVPIIKRFRIAATAGYSNGFAAGTATTTTLIADATVDGSRDAVTYKGPAVLKVRGGGSVLITGTGVTDLGNGRALLDAANWLAGRRSVTIKDSVLAASASGADTLRMTIVDSTSSGGPYPGALDSLIVYRPTTFSKIVVTAPSSVNVGTPFNVTLRLADTYSNRLITGNSKYVAVSANKLGVQLPAGEVYVADGQATFQATATMDVDSLIIRAYDVATGVGAPVQGTSSVIDVTTTAVAALDAPDTLIASDYMGADGVGDQGGFVALAWQLSSDHATLDGYRIYRQIQVTTGIDATTGKVVTLTTPQAAWVPWAFVDAVPGATIGRAIVATLDNVSTFWSISAERGTQTTAKEAFDGTNSIKAAYELMAGTMAASQAQQADVPVFATLTPEALSFIEKGVAPRMKSEGTVEQSALVQTAVAVRAVDNIAPAAVATVRAADTPNDAGSSITVVWSKSASDRLVVSSVPTAVGLGSTTYQTDGVAGYNVYRRVGTGAYSLVGQANPGQTSFADVTALNGVRYAYKVSPYDLDNVTESTVERSAMSVRNNAVDAQGVAVRGLFGMDSQVGFDDFFAFADNFGLAVSDDTFEPAFDLVANGKVDFEDFFAFADNFGRAAVGLGKVVPAMAGLNTDARLYMTAGAALPKVGDEVALDVNVANFTQLRGYGFTVSYDASKLEFVKVVRGNDALGSGELAAPQVLSQKDGEVSVGAFGEAVSEGEMALSVVFRTRTEIEESFVEVSGSEVRDASYGINAVTLPAPVQIQTRPDAFALRDNYPNPFNPSTTIKYALPEGAQVKLEVYNVVGQVVRTLVSGHQNAGRYVVQWDATNNSGHSLSSGIYFYRLQAGSEFTEVKKMLLLK